MDGEIKSLENISRPLVEVSDKEMSTKRDELASMMMIDKHVNLEVDNIVLRRDGGIDAMKGILLYRTKYILKNISQNVHSIFISLNDIEHQCSKALSLLTLFFNQWGPYSQLFDKLIPMMD